MRFSSDLRASALLPSVVEDFFFLIPKQEVRNQVENALQPGTRLDLSFGC